MKSLAQIAEALQGYDPQSLPVEQALAFLQALVEPIADTEDIALADGLDRILAGDLISPLNVPPHDNSAMDGYAFDGQQLQSASAGATALVLQVVGTALAGKAWQGKVGPGECLKIMTGAVLPQNLDTVVPQEFVTVRPEPAEGNMESIAIPHGLLQAGDNRRRLGEDLMQGQPALQQGALLTPAALGLLASLGIEQVAVVRRLRVAYFSTGDEILSLGDAPREGAVYDSNRYTVFGLLTRLGCEVIDLGVVRDDPAQLEAAFRGAALQADAIITSGGVSVGEADYTKLMMKKLGDVAFWKIAMRPGRPMAVGRIGQSILFAR
jgi:molybdopterin molybdotransferase